MPITPRPAHFYDVPMNELPHKRPHSRKLLIASSVALLLLVAAFAANGQERKSPDRTAASVAALKASLGNSSGLEVEEVRVTNTGVACINYHLSDSKGGKSPGHAVVQGDEVLKSPSGDERFEKAWTEHCLGPRGGVTSSGE